jgi:hypothetical protein
MSSRHESGPPHRYRLGGVTARVLVSLGLAATGLVAAPAVARAELVTRDAATGTLALAPDGSPRVAYVSGRRLLLAARSAGAWTVRPSALLPSERGVVVGLAVDALGRASILAEDDGRRWLVLTRETASGWRTTSLAGRLPAGALLGFGGLALDRRGAPAVAYAYRLTSGQTFLRLVRPDASGRLKTRGVTRKGFPPSLSPPAAMPVALPNGAVRVVEIYGGGSAGAAIEWRATGSDWTGKFLFSTPIGVPLGPIAAVAAADGTVYAAWTVLYGGLGEIDVVLATRGAEARSGVALRRAELVALALAPEGPELGANDRVALGETDTLFAGLVATPGGVPVELDGRLLGFAAAPDGSRQLLLAVPDGLSWFRASSPLVTRVSLAASPLQEGNVGLSGSVAAASGGTSVAIYRERPGVARELVATVPLAPDGSFTAADRPPSLPATYRAVYADPATGVPYAALLRTPLS